MKVRDLTPGDVIQLGDRQGLFVCQRPHPDYPNFQLVVWKMIGDERDVYGDALAANQVVGDFVRNDMGLLYRILNGKY